MDNEYKTKWAAEFSAYEKEHKRVSPFSIIFAVIAGLILLWIVVISTASLWADGAVYNIKQPVPVVRITPDEVTLSFDRIARMPMTAYCSQDLVCTNLGVHLSDGPCPVEPGHRIFIWSYPVSNIMKGTCTVRGVVKYAPLGWLGPTLTYYWESEEFEVIE
jgi:hypothetical protein